MPLPKQPAGDAASNSPAASPARGLPRTPPLPVAPSPIESLSPSEIRAPRPRRGAIPSAPIPNPETKAPVRTPKTASPTPQLPDFRQEDIRRNQQTPEVSLPEVIESLPDDLSPTTFAPQSSNQVLPKSAERSVYDELEHATDEDEDAILNRLLGLDDEEEIDDTEPEISVNLEEDPFKEEVSDEGPEGADKDFSYDDSLPEDTSEDITETSVSSEINDDDEEEFDFDAIMRELEASSAKSISSNLENENTQNRDEPESVVSTDVTDSSDAGDDEEYEDSPWESILNSLSDEEDEEVDKNDDKTESRASESLYEDDEDDDDENIDVLPAIEDDFVPPANPFANPYEDSPLSSTDEVTSTDEEISENDEDDDTDDEEDLQESKKEPKDPKKSNKLGALLSVDGIKKKVSDYLAGVKAELHGEPPPVQKPVSTDDEEHEESLSALEREYAKLLSKEGGGDEDKESDEDQDESDDPDKSDRGKRGRGSKGRGKGRGSSIFGFLSPVKALYMGLVNLIFGVISGILGILSKLPLIGFIFSAALGATNILKGIATYLPLVFVIGILATISYFSVPREAEILLPDSGSATLSELSFNSETMTATGTVTNTGDVIANVSPEFSIYTIQPELNPKTWFIPTPVATCVGGEVSVDIDGSQTVDMACSGTITGYIPRVGGVLSE